MAVASLATMSSIAVAEGRRWQGALGAAAEQCGGRWGGAHPSMLSQEAERRIARRGPQLRGRGSPGRLPNTRARRCSTKATMRPVGGSGRGRGQGCTRGIDMEVAWPKPRILDAGIRVSPGQMWTG